ncbi:rhomboid family protein [Dethiobacter alkaliphilus]|uniref:Peptidase S54 rhomboid domain-containing protein n=1 Tax=Dethiobacter alkaliphilus AHT 1 TaxID=555088 RepID=C0GJY6_DETAL|nr:hypothetical protein [Dethiobacter alkaliphilus]EEG76355.1 conserved hypothetical protein [Dethiobacter alkaliphilus AHT 1]
MKWINKLERKYGRYGIQNLMQFIVLGNALIFLLMQMDPRIPSLLAMHPVLVMEGEVWRLISFIFIPPTRSMLFAFFVLFFYYRLGTGLEHEWGTFKFNVFYLAGILATVIASFITGSVANAAFINMGLLLGFARIYPDYPLLLFIKVKYLAWLNWGLIGFNLLFGTFPIRIMSLVPVILFLLFFGGELSTDVKMKRQIQQNRKRFFSEIEKAKKNQNRE